MIVINSVDWSDCFSYGKNNSIQLDKNPIVQLVGKNGHGKSSIGLIIEELFFNKNSKGTKRSDVLNRHSGSTKYSISGTFHKDDDEYRIESSRGATQTIKFYKNSEDISSHTATGTLKLIESTLGLDSNSFSQLIYQSSASSLEFLTATDTNRKKFLINLLNLEEYTKAHDIFKEITKNVSNEVTVVSTKVNSVQSWLDTAKKSDLSEKPIQDVPRDITTIDTSEESSKITILTEHLKSIDSINKRINQNREYKRLLESIPVEEIVEVGPLHDISKETEESIELNRTIRDAKTFIKKMGPISDTCPTCSQPVDNTKSKELLKEQEKLILESEIRLKELQLILIKAEENNKWVDRVTKYKTEYENYSALIDPNTPDILLDKAEISTEITKLQAVIELAKRDIESQKLQIAEITAANNKALAHNAKIELIKEQMAEHLEEISTLSIQLASLEKRLSILQLLQKTFSTNGLVAYKIECMVKDLQNLTNQYLAELSSGRFQINFVMGSSDKLNVVIVDNGTEIDILALSSGERARVNTATLLAIRKLMQTLSSVRLNLLILDETIDNLDIDGKEKLVEVLLKEEHLNTILVSHGYSHALIEKISIIKENNISRIE